MKSQHAFNQVPTMKAPRSSFNLSHPHKLTFDAGWLVPILDLAVLPGDTIKCNLDFFARLATQLNPIMDSIYMETQFFFVPDRQLMDNFRKMMGEQTDPGDSIDYVYPILNQASGLVSADPTGDLTTTAGRTAALLDYIGVPIGIDASDVEINAMTLRGINHCYNQWYRDQNFIDSLPFNTDDGPDLSTDYQLFRRGKRHDYFTSCLPYPQKSATPVQLPLGTSAPLELISGVKNAEAIRNRTTDAQITSQTLNASSSGNFAAGTTEAYLDLASNYFVDLTTATAATINDLRESIQIQRLLERDMRSGTRYPEVLLSQYGVSNFYDLTYRPQYLGGGSSTINVHPVAASAVNTFTAPNTSLGELGAFATASSVNSNNHGFTQSFSEHGRIIGFISARAGYTYQQGLDRFLSKRTRYDVALPVLSHLGEQEILNKEIYCDGSATDDEIFGYNERFSEYRFRPGRLCGLFRSTATGSLDPWHLAQEFASLPSLGQTFLEENPPIDRVIAVPTEPHFICDMFFNITAARPLPVFGTPGLMDHF